MIRLDTMTLILDEPMDAALLFETVRTMNQAALEPVEMRFSSDMKTVVLSGTRVKLYELLDILYRVQLREKLSCSPTLRETVPDFKSEPSKSSEVRTNRSL